MPHRSSSQCSCPANGQLPGLPEEAACPPPRARDFPRQTPHLRKSIQSQGKAKEKQSISCARTDHKNGRNQKVYVKIYSEMVIKLFKLSADEHGR